jgi:hypothetical protein
MNVNARSEMPNNAESKEYRDFIESLSSPLYELRDLLKEENNGTHPVTYADVVPHNQNNINSSKHKLLRRKMKVTTPTAVMLHPKRLKFHSHAPQNDDQTTPREVVLTSKEDYCTQQRIDYIFLVTKKPNVNQTNNSNSSSDNNKEKGVFFQIKEKSTRVQPFFVNHSESITQLSDHYGIETVLVFN